MQNIYQSSKVLKNAPLYQNRTWKTTKQNKKQMKEKDFSIWGGSQINRWTNQHRSYANTSALSFMSIFAWFF